MSICHLKLQKLTGIHFKYTMGTGTCILNITCVLRIYQHTVVLASVGCIRLCASLHWSTNVFSIFFFLSVPLVALIFSSSEHKSKKGTCSATSLEELPEAILQPTIDVNLCKTLQALALYARLALHTSLACTLGARD